MNFIESLLNLFKKNDDSFDNIPEGACPNCWGRQEYGGKFYTAVKNHKASINQKDPSIGWVQDYANKYLKEIQIEEGAKTCKTCTLDYNPS